jgi:prepilin-type N-terminal cleavage/methylation domain-containing protein
MNKKSKAFTLIELLVVVAIVGILAGFVFVQLSGANGAALDAKKKSGVDAIRKAILFYQVEKGSYPIENNSCIVGEGCTNLDNVENLPNIPSDLTYTYQSNGTDCTISIILSTGDTYQYNCITNSYETNTPVNGVCGTKNNKYSASAPAGTEACISGVIADMTGSYSWTCSGVHGGTSSGACSTVAASYTVVSFTTVGTTTWVVPDGIDSVEYLVVGGGDTGDGNPDVGQGGGGGEVLIGSDFPVSGTITVVVGGSDASSSFSTITADSGLSGVSGNGYSGGGQAYGGAGGSGGGGGAGGPGLIGNDYNGGAGGIGIASSITGTLTYYGGGGGGASSYHRSGSGGAGGSGGGGAGALRYASGNPGESNTGGGGGGGCGFTPGAGGSGIVVIRYINND